MARHARSSRREARAAPPRRPRAARARHRGPGPRHLHLPAEDESHPPRRGAGGGCVPGVEGFGRATGMDGWSCVGVSKSGSRPGPTRLGVVDGHPETPLFSGLSMEAPDCPGVLVVPLYKSIYYLVALSFAFGILWPLGCPTRIVHFKLGKGCQMPNSQ